MARSCWNCASFDLGVGFDQVQCFACGAHMHMDGSPAVPTSALAPDGLYEGPGKELVEAPGPPHKAKDMVK